MAVVISEIVTEVVVGGGQATPVAGTPAGPAQPDVEAIVRMATERVLEVLRREWDR